MALFKKRKGGDEPVAAAPPPESIETLRRRARHRLIGAAVLVLLGVIGFPLIFDTQPRPIPVDIPIEIPDRNKVKPLAAPGAPAAQAPAVSGPVTGGVAPSAGGQVAKVEAAPGTEVKAPPVVEPKAEPKVEPKAEAKPAPRAEAKAEARPEARPPAKADPKSDEAARAQALLEGKAVAAAATAEGRFVVQVGAFADADKARDARRKVERAGLKTYTHVAETKDGRRIRVRVGPFPTRAEADKAAEKIKGLELPAAILTL
jgi:DedD protein